MKKYRHKPHITVTAEQFFPDKNIEEIFKRDSYENDGEIHTSYAILTPNGIIEISPSDYIVTGSLGQRYPVKENIFLETYEEYVEPPSFKEYCKTLKDDEDNLLTEEELKEITLFEDKKWLD